MKKTFTASIFIFMFCAFAFGQNSKCPAIHLTGPSNIIQPGETAVFLISVGDKAENPKLQFVWSVSSGKIIEGQRTSVITVGEIPWDSAPTATVEIMGLPEGCPNTASETGLVCSCEIASTVVDEFGKLSRNEEKARLSVLVSELKNRSDSDAYILFYHPSKNKKAFENRVARIKNFLIRDKKMSADRIYLISAGDEPEERIRIYIVPRGATPPVP